MGIAAIGQNLTILTGGIDLSIANTITFANVIAAQIMMGRNENLPAALFAVIVMGVMVGFINGVGIHWLKIPPFIMTLGVAMVASPGAPGGSIMTALPFLYMSFGAEAGDPDGAICAIMVALYITQDSFGTACNVSGDNAIGVIVNTIYERFIKKEA